MSEDSGRQLGERIRALRRMRGWSQKALAARSGVSMRFLGQMESGAANVSLARLGEVATALEVSVVALLAGSGPVHDAVDRIAAHAWELTEDGRAELLHQVVGSGPRHVSLVGLRGAGKSTIGGRAAKALGVRFVVVDDAVRVRSGLSLSDLFEMHGSTGYHRFCREVLETELASMEPVVLEIGGSVVADVACWQLLSAQSRVVWLRASAEAHLERVAEQGDMRPMEGFADAAVRLREILKAREPLYERAHIAIDTEEVGLDGAVGRVVEAAQSVTHTDDGVA